MLPVVDSPVFRTANGVPYLKAPGVATLAVPHLDCSGAAAFLAGFDPELGFEGYLNDGPLPSGEGLVKFAGQLCYLSFGENRTKNAQAAAYLTHIKESGHGSVLEHANYSFLIWGIDRSVTHELVRHRAGFAYSQVSQRYVDGKKLRFVERPEFQSDKILHRAFEEWIERSKDEYDGRAVALQDILAPTFPPDMPKTERRKRVNQAARSCLPNEVEAPIVVTGNARALRHILEMRGEGPAEVQIRRMTYALYECWHLVAPMLTDDYEVVTLSDGTRGLKTQYRKV